MKVVTKQEVGEAIHVRGLDGTAYAGLNGHWLINLEGKPATIAMSDEEYRARFQAAEETETTGRRTAPRAVTGETLSIPPAREGWATKTVSDRILATVTAEPMSAKDLIAAVDSNPKHASNVRSAIARLTRSGQLKKAGRGAYKLGAVK